jgi:glycosyltransferase involved in cell wall biosynthesis
MKLLMTTDTIGGVWTFSIDLIKALQAFDIKILVASLGRLPSGDQVMEIEKFPNVEFKPSDFKLEWMEDPWIDLEKAKDWISEISTEFKPDIVHLNSFSFDPDLFEAPVILTGHSCVASWWEQVKNESLPGSWEKYFRKVSQTIQKAQVVVAPSDYMLQNLIRFYGPAKNAKVIYNAGDSEFFNSDQEKEPVIFSMGRIWDEAKNMKTLVKAAAYLKYPVVIAGDNKNFTETIPANVKLTGQLNKQEVACWLAKAAVYVLPSLYEPFGLSVLEAAYSGCALILADIPSLREIWGDAALYFNPRNVQDLASKINEVSQNENLKLDLKSKALQRSQFYHLKTFATHYYSLYITLSKTTAQKSSVLYY